MTNNGCKRYCDVMNRPAYIVLFKGDDSDFEGNQSVDIVIDTELDTTGMKAHFRFMDFVQDFDSIPENKTLSLVFPNAKTSEFPLGAADATLRFEDASGKFRTVSNRIHIVVTNSVHEAYDNEDGQSITVTVKGTVTWEMIQGKPTIPAPVTIDAALSQTSENPVQNKVVTAALYTGFTEWVCDEITDGWTFEMCAWMPLPGTGLGWYAFVNDGNGDGRAVFLTADEHAVSASGDDATVAVAVSRHLITPTKTSQLTNDGPSSGPNMGHPFATTNQIPAPVDISGKLDGAAAYPAWEAGPYGEDSIVSHNGKLWKCVLATTMEPPSEDWEEVTLQSLIAAKQNALSAAQLAAVNSGATAAKVATWDGYAAQIAQKASLTDLPYAMVTPVLSDTWTKTSSGGEDVSTVSYDDTQGFWHVELADDHDEQVAGTGNETTLSFTYNNVAYTIIRPYTLLDRANNLIDATTGNVTLTLPPFVAGKVRDLLVACTIGLDTNDEPWSVIFQGQGSEAPSGADEISFKAEGDDAASATFPVPTAAGDWWYSLTERAPHVFAVSLKQLQSVSQPTQGGS